MNKPFFYLLALTALSFFSARATTIRANKQVIFNGNKVSSVKFYADEIPTSLKKKDLRKALRVKVNLSSEAQEYLSIKPKEFTIPLRTKKKKFKLSKSIKFRLKKNVEIPEGLNFDYELEAISEDLATKLNFISFEDSIFIAGDETGLKVTGLAQSPINRTLQGIANSEVSVYLENNPEEIITTTTTDTEGAFELNLGQGLDFSSSLIASIDIDGETLRAPIVSGLVNIDPISETISRETIEEGDSISVREANALIDQISNLTLNNLSFESLENSVEQVEDIIKESLDTITDLIGNRENTQSRSFNSLSDYSSFTGLYHFDSFTIGISANEDGSSAGLDANSSQGEARFNSPVYGWINISWSTGFFSSVETASTNSYQIEQQGGEEPFETFRTITPGLQSFSPFAELQIAEIEPIASKPDELSYSGGGQVIYYGYEDTFFVSPSPGGTIHQNITDGSVSFRKSDFGFDILTKQNQNELNTVYNNPEYKTLSLEAFIESDGSTKYSSAPETLSINSQTGEFTSIGNNKFIQRSLSPNPTTSVGEENLTNTGTISSSQNRLNLDFNSDSTENVYGSVTNAGKILTYFYNNINNDPQDSSLINSAEKKIVFGIPSHNSTVDLTQYTYRLFRIYISSTGNDMQIGSDTISGNLTIDSSGVATSISSITSIASRASESSPIVGDIEFNFNETYTINSEANGALSGTFEGLTLDGFASEDGKVLLMRAAEGNLDPNSTEIYFLLALAL